MPRPNAITAAMRFRQQLINNEAQAAERMARVYAQIFTRFDNDLARLAEQLAGMNEINPAKVRKLQQVRAMLGQIQEQVTRFGGVVQGEITNIQAFGIQQGIDNAINLIELSLPELSPAIRAQVVASLNRLPADAIEAAAGLLGPDSPLVTRLEENYGAAVAAQVEAHLFDGIAAGYNPRRIARLLDRNLQGAGGTGLTWAMNTIRTAQIKSYQIANHSTYAANNRIVPEWIWWAQLGDPKTCLSCINQHGTVYPYTETLNDHHSGRCVPIPKTITYRQLGINLPETVPPVETGQDWFARQPAATQRQMMGPGMYEAWQGGKFNFADLSKPYDDEVYGELLTQRPLRELIKQ